MELEQAYSVLYLVHKMTEWEPTTGDVHKLMREPSNINDSNAVKILSGKSGEKETQQADDVHPATTTLATAGRFEVIGNGQHQWLRG